MRKKAETLKTTDITDIPDEGRSRKQKETKVAKVVPNQVCSGIIFVSLAIFS